MDSTSRAPDVCALACVLFEMSPFNADPLSAWQLEPTIDIDRLVVLRDLIGLGHIGIEVVLAVEGTRLHRAVQGKSDTHCELDCMSIENGQSAR